MALDALPEELLVRIFTCFSWRELQILSLVCRRWYRVAGSTTFTRSVTLCLAKLTESYTNYRDHYIDHQLIAKSQRQYGSISCTIYYPEDAFSKVIFLGGLLECCLQRWKVKRLSITAQYEDFVLFFQYHQTLFVDLEDLHIEFTELSPTEREVPGKSQSQFFLELHKLKKFTWVEQLPPYSKNQLSNTFVFVLPQLQCMKVYRAKLSTSAEVDNLMLYDCTNVRVVDINSYSLLNSSLFDSDFTNLQHLTVSGIDYAAEYLCRIDLFRKLSSINLLACTQKLLTMITQFAADLTVLKLSGTNEVIRFDESLQQLSEICLQNLSLSFADLVICPRLEKLKLLNVKFPNHLNHLQAPLLSTLMADITVLTSLRLKSASSICCLGLFLSGLDKLHRIVNAPEFPSLRRLYLKLAPSFDATKYGELFDRCRHALELTVIEAIDTSFSDQKVLREAFPNVVSLHLHQLYIPEVFIVESANLKTLLLTNCYTRTGNIQILSQTETIRVHQLWWPQYFTQGLSAERYFEENVEKDPEIQLIPLGKHLPLDVAEIVVNKNRQSSRRTVYTTRGFRYRADDAEMLEF